MNRLIVVIFLISLSMNVNANNLSKMIYKRLLLTSYELSEIKISDDIIKDHQIFIFFGNDDLHNDYNKSLERALFSLLTRNCYGPSNFYCGFREVNQNRLDRVFKGRNISISIFYPESGFEEQVTEKFLDILDSTAQIVYLGHSRFGKGIDFYPSGMNGSLSTREIANKLSDSQLWLISCSSKRHFYKKIRHHLHNPSQLVTTSRAVRVQEAEEILIYSLIHEVYSLEGNSFFENIFNNDLLK